MCACRQNRGAPGPGGRHVRVIDAGDGLPLTVPRCCGSGSADPERVLLVVDDDRLTYADAERRSGELARGLLAAGLGPGSRVAVLLPERVRLRRRLAGGGAHRGDHDPAQHLLDRAELVGLLRGADVTMLLATPSYRSNDFVASLTAVIPGLDDDTDPRSRPCRRCGGWCSTSTSSATRYGTTCSPRPRRCVTPADRMVVVHTSGSTSEPKGVVHTHGALIRHLDNLNQLRRYTSDEVLFSNSPFFWIGGFAYALLGTLVAGATLVCSNSPTPPACSTSSSASGRRWSTASPPPSPTCPTTRPSPAATCRRSGGATSSRSCRPTSGRPTPSCATRCSG